MIEVVVIGHNEGAYVERMIKSVPSDWRIHYIADRCTDGTVELIQSLGFDNVDYIDTLPMHYDGRQTSYCRNLGLSLCDPSSDVLFLDGDRYVIQGDLSDLERSESDIQCLMIENDPRTKEMFREDYGCVYTSFFSCGLFMKRKAIDKVLDLQGQLFRIDMQDLWGIEDTNLGDVCYYLGLTAELNTGIRLRGSFEKTRLDTLDAMERRLRFRSALGYYGADNYINRDKEIDWEVVRNE